MKMIYTSMNNERIKNIKKLKEKKYRDKTGLFLIEGDHLIKEAYTSKILKEVILLEGDIIDFDIPVIYVSKEIMKELTDVESPSNRIGICYKKEEQPVQSRIIILDDIQDPGNLGAIIRSAVAFHVDTIVLSNQTVDLYNSKVIRSSQGMMFKVNIIRRDTKEFVKELKQKEYTILSTQLDHGKNIKTIEKTKKIAIIMGNEGKGVNKSLLELSDSFVYIKMNPECESLNVAVATSIILYELWGE